MASPELPRTPQQARSVASRARLLDATIACLIERGHAGTTTTEVAKLAGLSQGALYKHFPSKASLMGAAAERLFAQLIEGYQRAFEGLADEAIDDVEERLSAALAMLWELFRSPPLAAAIELYVAARTDAELATTLEPILAQHTENIRLEAERLFPELAGHPHLSSLVAGTMSLMQGAALIMPVSRTTGDNAEERAFIERVITAEARHVLEAQS